MNYLHSYSHSNLLLQIGTSFANRTKNITFVISSIIRIHVLLCPTLLVTFTSIEIIDEDARMLGSHNLKLKYHNIQYPQDASVLHHNQPIL